MIDEDLKNLIFELKYANSREDGKIYLTTVTDDGTTNYTSYSSFRCFCDVLILKYLK